MPTTYAHWRFGDDCIKSLDENAQKIVEKYRELFDFGVHGPDMFFYYNAMKSNEVITYGHWLHTQPFKALLAEFKRNYKKAINKEATLSYIWGFLAHFMLDSYCHGYVERKVEVSNVEHLKIESQYDRYLLIKDGFDPIKTSVTTSLKPSKQVSKVIAGLYDKWDEKTVYKSIVDQKIYLDLLKDNTTVKRKLLTSVFNKFNLQNFNALLIGTSADEKVQDSMLRLEKYYEKALVHYNKLFTNLNNFLNDGEQLDDYFNNTFNKKPDYKDIPILSYEDELKYQVNFQK